MSFLLLASRGLSPHARQSAAPRAASSAASPNFVTPLLPGNWETAQTNSKVHLPGYNASELYSGFFTVDKTTGSNSYFMFSTAMSGRKDAPVVLWLNGGPGASSLLGFYDELGPFGIDKQGQLVPREVSWNRDVNLLALDNPLGVGYSFTHSLERMATNQTTVVCPPGFKPVDRLKLHLWIEIDVDAPAFHMHAIHMHAILMCPAYALS